ncbi:peptidoglycan DD-metalloendopeptidase family protein [Novosphingobium sp.]|uniref:peptidoglycan DD-metalloendopeptidase family protein n=1 Tax=Novosphingobium sp. TaxID=1874826 RepID=UPI00286DFD8B|nr:peptidoglycan DD-metalloendopeptidase family protein [Novosphingobium sp.]
MRSQGQVRFIKISTRVQVWAASAVALFLAVWLGTMAVMTVNSYLASRDRLSLLAREAKVTSAETRVSAYKDDITGVSAELRRRQDAIEKMVGSLPQDIMAGETVSDSSSEAAKTIDKVSAVFPEAAQLARLEARQLAFVEGLTRLADRRAKEAELAIRKVGLDPAYLLSSVDDKSAMGGPFIAFASSTDSALDQRFQRLAVSLARLSALQRGLTSMPQVLPASLEFISSGFGYRSDPFTGAGAFHAGLDFKGPIGSPIHAAAQGKVSFVGQRQGYGNCVEVDHGNGMITRYAHMSAFRTTLGKDVLAGEVIGAIGNTGRSTGPHLHFEVRINDQAVNPRPFLEGSTRVQKQAVSAIGTRN